MLTPNTVAEAALRAEANSGRPDLIQLSESNDVKNSLKWEKVGFRSGVDASVTDILSFQIKTKGCD